MGGTFGKYGDAKRKAQIPKNHLIEKDMFKNYTRFARTFRSPSRNTEVHMISWEGLPFGSDLNISGFETIGRHQKSSYNGQDHRRKTWKQPSERKIYKVWHETYVRGEYFYNALTQGFYDGNLVPAFDTAIRKARCQTYTFDKTGVNLEFGDALYIYSFRMMVIVLGDYITYLTMLNYF